MMYFLLITLLILFFAWFSYRNEKNKGENEKLVYMSGNNPEDDSDADMQEQYAYLNEKREDD